MTGDIERGFSLMWNSRFGLQQSSKINDLSSRRFELYKDGIIEKMKNVKKRVHVLSWLKSDIYFHFELYYWRSSFLQK